MLSTERNPYGHHETTRWADYFSALFLSKDRWVSGFFLMGSNKLISPLRWKPAMELPFPTWWYIWRFCGWFVWPNDSVSVISKVSEMRLEWFDYWALCLPFKFRIFFKESWSNWEFFHIALVHQVESNRLRTLPSGPSQWGICGIRIIATLLSSGVVKRLLQQLWPWTSKLNPWEIATTAWALAKLQVVEDWRCSMFWI